MKEVIERIRAVIRGEDLETDEVEWMEYLFKTDEYTVKDLFHFLVAKKWLNKHPTETAVWLVKSLCDRIDTGGYREVLKSYLTESPDDLILLKGELGKGDDVLDDLHEVMEAVWENVGIRKWLKAPDLVIKEI